MSARELRGASQEFWHVQTLPCVTWPTAVTMPAGAILTVREDLHWLTLTAQSRNASAQLIVDLRTWEQVSHVHGDLAERAQLAVGLEALVTDRALHDRSRGIAVEPLPRMIASDPTTWSAMQVLAAATAARWSLPEALGGTPEEITRVNGAFLTVVWGL
ncbi:hypothetical protein ACTJKO_00190 [Curtobacterium sp. 22159]|uniref:hypothetical protein n=1 Tax=Curtobacterium sp. 22159 TaxID=3453882 RepID=UPI003F84577D